MGRWRGRLYATDRARDFDHERVREDYFALPGVLVMLIVSESRTVMFESDRSTKPSIGNRINGLWYWSPELASCWMDSLYAQLQ